MTVIVAHRDSSGAFVGSDSGVYQDEAVYIDGRPKVWQVGGALIGVSGGTDVFDAIEASEISDPRELGLYVLQIKPKSEPFEAIVVRKRTIHVVNADGSIVKITSPYHAIGSLVGSAVASGVLYALAKSSPLTPPPDRIRLALAAAGHHANNVRRPYVVYQL